MESIAFLAADAVVRVFAAQDALSAKDQPNE